jgi:hypothetical protein
MQGESSVPANRSRWPSELGNAALLPRYPGIRRPLSARVSTGGSTARNAGALLARCPGPGRRPVPARSFPDPERSAAMTPRAGRSPRGREVSRGAPELTVIANYESLASELFSSGEDLESYFDREVAPLPPPSWASVGCPRPLDGQPTPGNWASWASPPAAGGRSCRGRWNQGPFEITVLISRVARQAARCRTKAMGTRPPSRNSARVPPLRARDDPALG